MKIVHKGVRIEDTPWAIDITPNQEDGRPLHFAGQYWTVENATAVRDALTEALRQLELLDSRWRDAGPGDEGDDA